MDSCVVVSGYFVRNPSGGHALSILHYLVGLKRLGLDVVFVEHHGWPDSCYDPELKILTDDPSHGINYMLRLFDHFDLRKWCYIDAGNNYHGISRQELANYCSNAACLVSLWNPTWTDELYACHPRVFIDTDPGFTQFRMRAGEQSGPGYASPFDFDLHFSYGSRLGAPDCPIPLHALQWRPIRPPIVLDMVPERFAPHATNYTTVMSWSSRAPIVFRGEEYGQKDIEFWRIAELPRRVSPKFEIALSGRDAPRDQIAAAGWRIADPAVVARTPSSYRDYIARSRGEFSVAVNLEVKSRSGWFSDRTAAYLASGKPAIVQETGFSDHIPIGRGLMSFHDLDEAVEAIQVVEGDYTQHCRAAHDIAEEFFRAESILAEVLQAAGVDVKS